MVLSKSEILDMLTENKDWFIKEIESKKMIKKILISPCVRENFEPASYDISVGSDFLRHSTGEKGKLNKKNPVLKIQPGESVTILSREYVGLPQGIIALVISRTGFLSKGLTQISAHIDPGFHGNLIQNITNLSNKTRKVQYGQPFAHLMFFKVSSPDPREIYTGPHLGQTDLERLDRDGNPLVEEWGGPTLYLRAVVGEEWKRFLNFLTIASFTIAGVTSLGTIQGVLDYTLGVPLAALFIAISVSSLLSKLNLRH